MKDKYVKNILDEVSAGNMTVEEAGEKLRSLPYKELGFAKVDNHRTLRTGYAEVVFCEGKTPEQTADILCALAEKSPRLMGTRASEEAFEAVKAKMPDAVYHETARIIEIDRTDRGSGRDLADRKDLDGGKDPAGRKDAGSRNDLAGRKGAAGRNDLAGRKGAAGRNAAGGPFDIAVVTAGTADIPVAEEAAVTAEIMGRSADRIYDVGVSGIHRLLDNLDRIKSAGVVIVVAGMEGALASVIGGLIDNPIVSVPTSVGYGSNFEGLSALLCMLNSCASGVGVVNIDNGFGAAALAVSILDLADRRALSSDNSK